MAEDAELDLLKEQVERDVVHGEDGTVRRTGSVEYRWNMLSSPLQSGPAPGICSLVPCDWFIPISSPLSSNCSPRLLPAPQLLTGPLAPAAAFAPLVEAVCSRRELLHQFPGLRSSAVLALCKLMAIDAAFCERNLQVTD
eukprot:996937-Prorocentrum_minimum.AAC.1